MKRLILIFVLLWQSALSAEVADIIEFRIPIDKKALAVFQEVKSKTGKTLFELFQANGVAIRLNRDAVSLDEKQSFLNVKASHANTRIIMEILKIIDSKPKEESVKICVETFSETSGCWGESNSSDKNQAEQDAAPDR